MMISPPARREGITLYDTSFIQHRSPEIVCSLEFFFLVVDLTVELVLETPN